MNGANPNKKCGQMQPVRRDTRGDSHRTAPNNRKRTINHPTDRRCIFDKLAIFTNDMTVQAEGMTSFV
jgi:hypothetical protein